MWYRDNVERCQETYFRNSNVNLRNTVLGDMIKDEKTIDQNAFEREMKERELTPQQRNEQVKCEEEERIRWITSMIKQW